MSNHTPSADAKAKASLAAVLDVADVPEGARRILEAAAYLFARKGYESTTMRTIAAAAQVTVPMVYYYFEGKEQIFVKLFESVRHDFFRRLNAIQATHYPSFHAELLDIMRVFRALLYPNPVILQLMAQLMFGPPESSPLIEKHGGRETVNAVIRDIFESAATSGRFSPPPGFEPADLSVYFMNLTFGHTMCVLKQMELSDVDPGSLYQAFLSDETLHNLVDIFLNGASRNHSRT